MPDQWPSEVIYKYALRDEHCAGYHDLPLGAQIVHAGLQGGGLYLWIKHTTDPAAPKELRSFWLVGTGQEFPAGMTFVGTYFNGAYVWHVLEATA